MKTQTQKGKGFSNNTIKVIKKDVSKNLDKSIGI